jgi:hypothetical protein
MNEKRRGNRRRIVTTALAAALLLAGAAMGVVLPGSSPLAPRADEMQAMEATIEQRFDLEATAVATASQPSFATAARVPESLLREAKATYEKGLNEIATPEYVAWFKGWPQMVADSRQHGSMCILKEEHRVLDFEHHCTLGNGHVAVSVKV